MRKFFLILAASFLSTGVFAEGYQVNNMSAKQTGMGHVGTAMKLNSESIFFNPAAAAFQSSKFDISVGFTGIISKAKYQGAPSVYTDPQTGKEYYGLGESFKSDNGLSTPLHIYFNYKPTKRLALGLGFYTPDGSVMKWPNNWAGAHLVQNIELKAFAVQPTISYKITDNFSIGAGLTINWGNFSLSRSVFRMNANQELADFAHGLPQFIDGLASTGVTSLLTPEQMMAIGALKANAGSMEENCRTGLNGQPLLSAELSGNADVAVGVNAGFLWDINDEWSFGMTWRSRLNMKVSNGNSRLIYGNDKAKTDLGMLNGITEMVKGLIQKPEFQQAPLPEAVKKQLMGMSQLPNIANMDGASFAAELPLPTSVTWGVSFRPTPKWEFAVDLQWVGWSAYDYLTVQFNAEAGMPPIVSKKSYSNTLAFRFGGQYRATDFVTARMGMYVDESPVSSSYLNPETPSMTKVSYTAGLTLRPSKKMDIDLAYCYVSSADPERTGAYPYINNATKKIEKFEGNYSLHAHVFSIGMNFKF